MEDGQRRQGVAAIVVVVLAGLVSTWTPDAPGAAGGADDHLAVMSGGVGKEEADRMRMLAPEFPLELVFVRRVAEREEFVADVRLSIADSTGRVLVDRTSGPMVLVRVPEGVYTISADYAGQVKTRRVAVGNGSHEKISLVWT